MNDAQRTAWLPVSIAALGCFLVLSVAHVFAPLTLAINAVNDAYLRTFAQPVTTDANVVILAISDETFSGLRCRSPVDREFIARLVKHLDGLGAAAIGIDLLFDAPTSPAADQELLNALHQSTAPVAVITAHDATNLTPGQQDYLHEFLEGIPTGYANLSKDPFDGVVRIHRPQRRTDERSFPAVLVEALGHDVPTRPFTIDWRSQRSGPSDDIASYPAHALSLLPAEWIKDKIVLIGVTVAGTDSHRAPFASVPGVRIHAEVISQILDGRDHPQIAQWLQWLLAFAAGLLGVRMTKHSVSLWTRLAITLAVVLLIWIASAIILRLVDVLIPPLEPSLGMLFCSALMLGWLQWRDHGERRTLMSLFAHHVSAPVAAQLWEARQTFMEGGKPRPQALTASVLFSDIERFTTISERLSPEDLMHWLETYLDAMVAVVDRHNGIVLRFIGDGILATFGVPVARTTDEEIAHDARNAVAAGLAMADALKPLNASLENRGLPPIAIRVGIHTGPLIVGSLGGSAHMEFSLVGDTANIAARLEAYAKNLRGPDSGSCTVLVSQATAVHLTSRVLIREVGELSLKGKDQNVRAFEVILPRDVNHLPGC